MFKRFMIGFVLGVAGMYWYIHHGAETLSGAGQWMERSAGRYRHDTMHESVQQQTGGKAP